MNSRQNRIEVWRRGSDIRSRRHQQNTDRYRKDVIDFLETLDEQLRQQFLDSWLGDSLINKDFNDAEFMHELGASVYPGSLADVSQDYGDRPDIADYFLTAGCSSDQSRTDNGYTGLHLSAGNGDVRLLKWFLDKGVFVDIGTEVDDDESPLDIAVRNRQLESVITLLQAGADPDRHGKGSEVTPRDRARKLSWHEGIEAMIKHVQTQNGR